MYTDTTELRYCYYQCLISHAHREMVINDLRQPKQCYSVRSGVQVHLHI